MSKQTLPLFTDNFLDDLAKEISEIYGFPALEQEDSKELSSEEMVSKD